MNIPSDDFSLIFKVIRQSPEMRSLTIVLFVAICASNTIVRCQDDNSGSDDGFFFRFFFMTPTNYPAIEEPPAEISSYRDDGIFAINSDVSPLPEDEPKTQEYQAIFDDVLPSDGIFNAEQSPLIVDEIREYPEDGANEPVVQEPIVQEPERDVELFSIESVDKLSTPENTENAPSMESKENQPIDDNSEERNEKQAQINAAFMRAFAHIVWSMPDSAAEGSLEGDPNKEVNPVEVNPTKGEPTEDKFNGKKYVEDYFREPLQKKPPKLSEKSSKSASLEPKSADESAVSNTKEDILQERSTEIDFEVVDSVKDRETTNQEEEDTEYLPEPEQGFEEIAPEEKPISYEAPFLAPFLDDYNEAAFADDDLYVVDPLGMDPPAEVSVYQDETAENEEQSIANVFEVSDKKEESVEQDGDKKDAENVEDEILPAPEEIVPEEKPTSYEAPFLAPFPDDFDGAAFDDNNLYFVDPLGMDPPAEDSISQDEIAENEEQSISDVVQVSDKKEESLEQDGDEKDAENVEDEISPAEGKEEFMINNFIEKENEIPMENIKPMGRLSFARFFRALLDAIPLP